jgi:predicted dehydrogenase
MNVGLIGLGVMGYNHYRVLQSIAEANLVAVCDVNGNKDFPQRVYSDCSLMLDSERLDAIVVAVPTSFHYEVASQTIARRIPTLIEKPIAATIEEAEKLIALRNEHHTLTAVGHVERFNPVVRSLIDELNGKEVYTINITRIGPFPPRINDMGVLVDLSVHDIDLVHCLTRGNQIEESRIYKSRKRVGNREDNAVITLRFENDVVANITTNWLTPFKKRTIEVATDKAFYSADLMVQELTEYSAYTKNNSYLVRKCAVKKGEPLRGELEAFLHFAATGEPDGLASLEDGLLTLNTIYKQRYPVTV